MKFSAKVYEPMYEHNEKKYIRFTIPQRVSEMIERMHANREHLLTNKSVSNPLEGQVLKVKVPFRYRRVMCEVKGRPLQSLIRGDEVEIEVDFKGIWNVGDHSGFSWILSSSSVGSSVG
jgi:flagellar motor switch protein FliM